MRAFYEDGDKQEISRYLKAALALTGVGLWEWDLDDGSIQGDDRLAEILGLPVETLQTFSLEAWSERVHESERAAFLEAAEAFDGEISSGFDEIYRMQRGDGRWIWVHDRSGLIRPDHLGRPRWLFGVLEDITERHEEQQSLRRLSVTDELTGLYNRRHLLGCMEEELARFRRFGTPFSLVVIDLDHFKDVNDRYGHVVGDVVLQQLARLFEDRLREIDVAGRTGGEEFLLVLPGTAAEGGLRIAEDLRHAFAAMAFQGDDGEDFRVTLSTGVATVSDADERLHHLWARADRDLYAAKEAGRDRVIKQ